MRAGRELNEDKPGTVLDMYGYSLTQTIGHGSYSTVHEAFSTRYQTYVAIKIVSKRRAPDDFLTKFLPREISILQYLKHDNLILFLQSIETNTRVYIIMEEASGGDLLNTVRKQKRIAERQAAIWFRQLSDGVEYCHQRGVVHRDLKCENLLLDAKGNVKITDFGFARSEMFPINGVFQRSATFCGSYAYAAPEILVGKAYIPQMADVWSMGVILYVMVIGRLPFDDSNLQRLVKLVLAGPVFPANRPSSALFQQLVSSLLTTEDSRIGIPQIRLSPFYAASD